MKQLLNGVAIAAVFALAVPALAQNLVSPPMPSAPAPAPAAPPPVSPAPPPAPAAAPAPAPDTGSAQPMAAAPVRHHRHHVAKASGDPEGDQLTQQLNQQELDHTGGAPPPMSGPGAPPPPPPVGR